MQEQPYGSNEQQDARIAQNHLTSGDLDAYLSAVVPQVDERFRHELEEHLVRNLQASQSRQAAVPVQTSSAAKRPLSVPLSSPALRRPMLGRGLSRAASFVLGALGVLLLGSLLVLMSAMLGGRHPSSSNPQTHEQPQNSPYTSYTAEGGVHIAVVAGYNLPDSKPGKLLFIYAMKTDHQGLPIVTALLQTPTPGQATKLPDTIHPNPTSTPYTFGPTPISTAPAIIPGATIAPASTITVTEIQSLGQIGEFQVGVIYTNWVRPPEEATFVLRVAPPGSNEVAWQVTPLVDFSLYNHENVTTFFKNSPPEMGQVTVACPCGPQAFRLAILGRPAVDAPPLILGIDDQGAVALLAEAEYFRILSPQGTPFPTEDTEHVHLAPTYPPTSTTAPDVAK